MTAAPRLDADLGIYVTDPAATPRRVWLDEAEQVDLFALCSSAAAFDSGCARPHPPKSGMRRRGKMDLEGM